MNSFIPNNGLVPGPTVSELAQGAKPDAFRTLFQGTAATALFDYWLEFVRDGGIPHKRRFDPLRVPKLLSRMYIEEWEPNRRQSRFRLMGEELRLYFDEGAVGLCTSDHVSGSVADLWDESDQLVYFERRPVLLAYDFSFRDRPHITVADLSLPFVGDGEDAFAIGYIWETAG